VGRRGHYQLCGLSSGCTVWITDPKAPSRSANGTWNDYSITWNSEGRLNRAIVIGNETLRLLLRALGFGVVLGDDWARRHCLLVDYGSTGTEKTAHVQPSLLLRSKHLRLTPTPTLCKPKLATDKSEVTDLECCLITAQQAKRFLRQPRQGSRHPFLV
jgi:hypothetical protein